jgi:hypothetical protein
MASAQSLLGSTTYKRMAPLEEAPLYTDCLTSIHYIFQRAWGLEMSLTFIGDLPRSLLDSRKWTPLFVDQKEILPGDLLFVKNIMRPRLVEHAVLSLGGDQYFHCRKLEGARIESLDELYTQFEQKLTTDIFRYIDPRNKRLRDEHKGYFIV